jgi:hypothetical protein
VEFYRHLQQDLGVDLKLWFCGYLWCFTQNDYTKVFHVLEELKAKGFAYKEYLPEEL